jgi:hypothetical protein
MKLTSLPFIVLLLTIACQAQGDFLPEIEVKCPEVAKRGDPVDFRITVDPPWSTKALSVIKYSWTASFGEITSGQGTDSIQLNAKEPGNVTATVLIDNVWFDTIERRCTTRIYAPPRPQLVSDFRAYNIEYVEMMLETLLNDLRNDPTASGHIILHGKNSRAVAQLDRTVRNRIKIVRFNPSRITIIRGNDQPDARLEFWLIPPGAGLPK